MTCRMLQPFAWCILAPCCFTMLQPSRNVLRPYVAVGCYHVCVMRAMLTETRPTTLARPLVRTRAECARATRRTWGPSRPSSSVLVSCVPLCPSTAPRSPHRTAPAARYVTVCVSLWKVAVAVRVDGSCRSGC